MCGFSTCSHKPRHVDWVTHLEWVVPYDGSAPFLTACDR
jgi:hypothetical protein